MSIRSNEPRICKILIMGLDNSGKTSILISLCEDCNLLSYLSLKPTRGINIERFETQELVMSCWDFGGQAEYREEYLKNLNSYLKEVDKIIYVIDVQDVDRYNLALEYFKNIISKLKKNDILINFSIFLHKYDPNLSKREEFKDIDTTINSKLIKELRILIPPEFNYDIFKTTIYTVFEKTLV